MKTSIIFAAAASAASTAIELAGASGTWTSPGYPAYKGNCHQRYFKAVGPQEVLVLDFEHVDIEFDEFCTFDFLMINGQKICQESGSNLETTMTSTTASTTTTPYITEMQVVDTFKPLCLVEDLDALFHTDSVFNYAGFKINWEIKDLCSYKCMQADILAKQAANC